MRRGRVGLVNARVGADESAAMLDDNQIRAHPQYFGGLAQDQFDDARVFAAGVGQFLGRLRWRDGLQVHQPAFGLTDDLLRDDQHVAALKCQPGLVCRVQNNTRQVVAGLNDGDAGKGGQFNSRWVQPDTPQWAP